VIAAIRVGKRLLKVRLSAIQAYIDSQATKD
jgi:hypothetical protein